MKSAEDVLGYAAEQGIAEAEHMGLSALAGLKLRAEDLQIDVFHDAAVATFRVFIASPGDLGDEAPTLGATCD